MRLFLYNDTMRLVIDSDVAAKRADCASPAHWSVPLERVRRQEDMRLDATWHKPSAPHMDGDNRRPLRELAVLHLPNRFERIWTDASGGGRPYLNASDLLMLFAHGEPAQQRWLSPASCADLSDLIIRRGWILMTCSGTVGRVYPVTERLDGWVATHDLVRIKPKCSAHFGFLFAWLKTAEAQQMLHSAAHGGQISHVTKKQVSGLAVPCVTERRAASLNALVLSALSRHEAALQSLAGAWTKV